MMQRSTVKASTSVTSALMSGAKPSRIMDHSLTGSVLSVPVTSKVIMVSSKESAKPKRRQVKIAKERGFNLHEHSLQLFADCIKQDCPRRLNG